jgi:hypothetical protein
MAFWKKLLQAFQSMNFERSKADPCLDYAWTKQGLVIWLSWTNNCLVIGQTEGVKKAKKRMTDCFDHCDIIGNMNEYVGCKIERNTIEGWIKFMQPVLLQSCTNKFEIPEEIKPTSQILIPCDPIDMSRKQSKARSEQE